MLTKRQKFEDRERWDTESHQCRIQNLHKTFHQMSQINQNFHHTIKWESWHQDKKNKDKILWLLNSKRIIQRLTSRADFSLQERMAIDLTINYHHQHHQRLIDQVNLQSHLLLEIWVFNNRILYHNLKECLNLTLQIMWSFSETIHN